MELAELISHLQQDPRRLGLNRSFSSISAFFLGIEVGAGFNGVMYGFTEWLVPKLSGSNSWPWEKLVVKHALGEQRAAMSAVEAFTPQEDEACLASLYELLAEFEGEQRQTHLHLRQVYWRYNEWLRAQDWFVHDGSTPGT